MFCSSLCSRLLHARRMREIDEAAQKVLDEFEREHQQERATARPQARVCRMRAWQSGNFCLHSPTQGKQNEHQTLWLLFESDEEESQVDDFDRSDTSFSVRLSDLRRRRSASPKIKIRQRRRSVSDEVCGASETSISMQIQTT